jgi:hypothetical protein
MILLYVPHTYAGIMAGKNQDVANPRKTEEHLAKDDSLDKVVSITHPCWAAVALEHP